MKIRERKNKTDKELKKDIEDEYKEMIFNLKEATGNGNYSKIEQWTVSEITDFIDKKNKQIAKAKNGRK